MSVMYDSLVAKFPPGPPPNLIRALFGAMQQNPLDYFTAMAQKYGDVSGMRIGNFRSLFVNHPDLIEDVLVNNARKFHKGRILQANKYLFGEGLLTSEGDFWLRQRRLSQPAFHRARINAYAATMAEYTEQLVSTWRNGEERDIHEEMMQLALRIVGKTLFDADVTQEAKEVGEIWPHRTGSSVGSHAAQPSRKARRSPTRESHLSHHLRTSRERPRYRR